MLANEHTGVNYRSKSLAEIIRVYESGVKAFEEKQGTGEGLRDKEKAHILSRGFRETASSGEKR